MAKKLNKKWLLLLDQDTYFPLDAVRKYLQAIQRGTSQLLAPMLFCGSKMISPFRDHHGSGQILRSIKPASYSLQNIMPVNSGMMVSLKSFIRAGGYDCSFPLDYSDFTFISRYRQHESSFEVLDIKCQQEFSGIDVGSFESSLVRFKSFCRASILYKDRVDERMHLWKILTKRALKLSITHKSTAFIKTILMLKKS